MVTLTAFDPAALERLSALVDGELDPADASAACEAWRADAEARASWHAYQLIGDVLRSEDLASRAARDSLFLVGVRERMASEPTVLAPDGRRAPSPGAAVENGLFGRFRPRSAWALRSAVAAGVVVAVGVFSVVRDAGPSRSPIDADVAMVGRTPLSPRAGVDGEGLRLQTVLASNQMIRDARLDGYLAAHKQFAGTSVLGAPSVFLRSATVDSAVR